MRLIDADRLLEDKRIEKYYHLKNGDTAIPIIDIRHAPTVEERKKGEWIETVEDWRHQVVWWKCSECGMDVSTQYNYCPDCGADMKGERDDS